jgi:hypothetical protein
LADLSYKFTGVNTAQLANEVRLLRQNSSTFRALEADTNFSGGLPGRLAALAGIDPQDPSQLVPPPLDEQLRGFYRDDPIRPWFVQRRR